MPDRSNVARRLIAVLLALVAGLSASQGRAAQTVPATKAQAPKTVRLYIFDCGVLNVTTEGVERYHVTTAEVRETRMSVPCFLVAHPKGTLMWDVGVIPDGDVEAQPQGAHSNVNPLIAAVVTERSEVNWRRSATALPTSPTSRCRTRTSTTARTPTSLRPRSGSRGPPSASSCGPTTMLASTRRFTPS